MSGVDQVAQCAPPADATDGCSSWDDSASADSEVRAFMTGKNPNPDLTGEAGIHLVGLQVTSSLGWAFRAQPVLDYGIDAEVEIKVDNKPTGRLLALQIKAGQSWFDEPTAAGWIFRPSERHVQYWLDHVLPVVVVLVDLETGDAFWQHVSTSTTRSTGKNYSLEVLRKNTVATAQAAWEILASDLVPRAHERYETNLKHLPPMAVEALASARTTSHARDLLALHLAEGRAQPEMTVATLLAAPPSWLDELAATCWRVIAAYSTEHELHELAAEAYLRADQLDAAGGRFLAAAGLALVGYDRERANDLLHRALETERGGLVARIGLVYNEQADEVDRPLEIPHDLDLSTTAAREEPLVHAFLGLAAARRGDDEGAVRCYIDALRLRPNSSAYMLALADASARRGVGPTPRSDDLRTAARLARDAFEQRRRWNGPMVEALRLWLRIEATRGDYELVLQQAAPPPIGQADVAAARDIDVARHALHAAAQLERDDIVSELLDQLPSTEAGNRLRQQFRREPMTPDGEVAYWESELRWAQSVGDFEVVANSVLRLARLGTDRSSVLAPVVERGHVPQRFLDLVRSLLIAGQDLEAALPGLRVLADHDVIAAQHLALLLADDGRHAEAAQACFNAWRRLHHPDLLALRVDVLLDGGDLPAAESAAHDVVAAPDVAGVQKARGLRVLAQAAANRQDWERAEQYLQSALESLKSPDVPTVWNLVAVQLNQRRHEQAAATISLYRPPARDPADAWLWLRATMTQAWADAEVEHALTLAGRFADDAQLSTALLSHIIMSTRGDDEGGVAEDAERLNAGNDQRGQPRSESTDASAARSGDLPAATSTAEPAAVGDDPRPVVSASLRQEAFQALDAHLDRHGEGIPLRKITGTPEELLEEIRAQLAARDKEPLRHVLEQVRRGEVPAGLVCLATGRPYGLVLVQRASGLQVAVAANDDQHESEMADARDALGTEVVVEASALLLAESIGRLSSLRGHFRELLLPVVSRDDITATAAEAYGLAASTGMLDWDEQRQRLVLHELSPVERAMLVQRAQTLDEAARRTLLAEATRITLFPDLDEPGTRAWLAPLQLAADRGAALWSDDAALRALARGAGIATFGTAALNEALVNWKIERADGDHADAAISAAADEQSDLIRQLMREYVVDLPVTVEAILAQAADDDWMPAAGAVPLSRATWWAWSNDPIGDLLAVYNAIAAHRPDALPGWQFAAMEGAAAAWKDPPEAAALAVACVALLRFGERDVQQARDALDRAAQLAIVRGLPSPQDQVPAAAKVLARAGHLAAHEEFAVEVLREL